MLPGRIGERKTRAGDAAQQGTKGRMNRGGDYGERTACIRERDGKRLGEQARPTRHRSGIPATADPALAGRVRPAREEPATAQLPSSADRVASEREDPPAGRPPP